jgi:fructoselysine-6-P-deglycase FrlB-like protein
MNRFLKDILDQPAALSAALDYSVTQGSGELRQAARMLASARRVVLTSMGSALYSLIPLYRERSRAHPCVHLVETADLIADPPPADDTLYLIMSRSGESGEVASFSAWLRERKLALIAISMTPESTLARNASLFLRDPVPYDGFICTKAYTTMTLIGLLLAAEVASRLGPELVSCLRGSFDRLEGAKEAYRDKAASTEWLDGSLYFLSYGPGLALSLSGALWLEEAARVPASTMSIANFLHGPVEQVDGSFRGVWIDLSPDARSRAAFAQAASHGGCWLRLMADAPESDFDLPSLGLPPQFRVLAAAMPIQLVAWQTATRLGIEAGSMRYLDWVVK